MHSGPEKSDLRKRLAAAEHLTKEAYKLIKAHHDCEKAPWECTWIVAVDEHFEGKEDGGSGPPQAT